MPAVLTATVARVASIAKATMARRYSCMTSLTPRDRVLESGSTLMRSTDSMSIKGVQRATACPVFRNGEPDLRGPLCVCFPMVVKRANLSLFVQFNIQIGAQPTANLGEDSIAKRAIARGGGGSAEKPMRRTPLRSTVVVQPRNQR